MRRLASVCLALGGAVAVIGVIGVALGFRPSALPPALLDLAAFKLVFIAAGGLIAAGAVLGRAAQRDRKTHDRPGDEGRAPAGLPAGAPRVDVRAPESVREHVETDP